MKGVLIPTTGPATEVEVDYGWRALAAAISADYIEIVRPVGFGPRHIREGYPVLVTDEEALLHDNPVTNVGASLIYGGHICGPALVLGEALVADKDGFDEPDLVGLEKIADRSADGWVGYVNHVVQHLAREHGRGT